MASLHKTTTATAAAAAASSPSSTTLRFLGLLKLPEPDLTPLELHESDVVWSPVLSSPSPSPAYSSTTQSSPSLSTAVSNSSSPTNTFFRHHQFHPDKSGLSAALSDDLHPLVRRKPNLSPSISAATAARTIPPVAIMSASAYASGSSSFKYHQSAPVNVPIWQKKMAEASGKLGRFDDEIEIVEEEDEKEMIPPHEIVARTYVTFSVFEGAGRTLKGRDLRRVRNAVFQKTGFLD